MIYTIPCQTGAGCSCGGPMPCDLCNGYTDLIGFAEFYGFPSSETPDISFPFTYSGSDLSGITLWKNSDIISTSGYLIRAGCTNTGSPSADDQALLWFTGIVKSDVTVSYEYWLQDSGCVDGGKHLVTWFANTTSDTAAMLSLGTWSTNATNTLSYFYLDYAYHTPCKSEFPVAELVGLPQTQGVWRTRTIEKNGDVVTFTDGDYGPVEVTRCWFPLNGTIGLTLGPGVRVRNITISI